MIGIDEVGRGAWAGPLVVAAVRINTFIDGLADSKKLSIKKRQYLDGEIRKISDIGLGWVWASEINAIGLAAALKLASERAVSEIEVDKTEQIVIDGTVNFLPDYPNVITIPKADGHIPEVSAASIVAKVARDNYMAELPYINYSFEKHVGYGTALHSEALIKYGTCAEHRLNFRPVIKYQQIFEAKA